MHSLRASSVDRVARLLLSVFALLLVAPLSSSFGQSSCQDTCYANQGKTAACCPFALITGGGSCIAVNIDPTDCLDGGLPTLASCMKRCPSGGSNSSSGGSNGPVGSDNPKCCGNLKCTSKGICFCGEVCKPGQSPP